MRYVLFRENPNTHQEVYLKRVEDGAVVTTTCADDAIKFRSSADAYRFGAMHNPLLDWWHAGLR